MQPINSIQLPADWDKTIPTGFDSFDELLGNTGGVNGARYGKLTLLSAQSGTGKTRLCIQVLDAMARRNNIIVAHVTSEQSENVVAATAKSMGVDTCDNFLVARENRWEQIEYDCIRNHVKVVVIDSYPMLVFDKVDNKKLDTKERLEKIAKFAEDYNVQVILLNHTDKAGNRAGRNELMHLVDVAYTMNKSDYDGIKVIEFHNDKNREGTPVSRAFPFNGIWDLDTPFEIKENEDGKGAAATGEQNGGKVAQRKKAQREAAIRAMHECNGVIARIDVDNGEFTLDGMIPSAIKALFRTLVEEDIFYASHDKSGKPGKPQINAWMRGSNFETALSNLE